MTLFLTGLVVGAILATLVGGDPPDDPDCVYCCWDDEPEIVPSK